jgi:hypothetical protein
MPIGRFGHPPEIGLQRIMWGNEWGGNCQEHDEQTDNSTGTRYLITASEDPDMTPRSLPKFQSG